MSLSVLVILASVLGAGLFFAAGWLLASGRKAVRAESAEPATGEVWSDAVRAQLDTLRGERDEAARARDEAAARREELELEVQRLGGAASKAMQEAEQARARVAVLERPSGPRPAADDESWRAAAATADRRATEALAEVEARKAELAEARKQVAALTSQLETRSMGVEQQQRDLGRLRTDLERACDEIAALRLERHRADQAEAARATVESELQKLKALQFASSSAGAAPLSSVDLATGAKASAASLADLVRRVQDQGHYESVAIADELGLTAAGVGPHTDELAAFTSLLLGVSARASRFFPMHDFGHATLTDAHGVSIEARPVSGPQGFVLMTLGAVHPQEQQ